MVMLVAFSASFAWAIWRRNPSRRSRIEELAFTLLLCLALGLALRFGGRTYPGIYFPESSTLNSHLNGVFLFTGIGYLSVLLTGAASVLKAITAGRPKLRFFLSFLIATALTVASIISLYGFYWAFVLERLPG